MYTTFLLGKKYLTHDEIYWAVKYLVIFFIGRTTVQSCIFMIKSLYKKY
jgi:hypothetical protein